nr:PHP domain-containing protein [Candidatus Sigynarchaeota archaeon]
MADKFHFFDLHVHTPFSDAQYDLDMIVQGLIDNGIKIVGFTDHIFPFSIYHNPKRFGDQRRWNNCYSVSFLRYRKEFFRIYNKKYPKIRFLNSGEIDINPRGQLTLPRGITTDFFDYTVVVKHQTVPKHPRDIYENMWEGGVYKAWADYRPDVFAHPHENMPKHFSKEKMKRFILYAKKYDVAIELNKQKPINEEWFKPVLEYGHEYGVKFSICSDYHGFKKPDLHELDFSQQVYHEIVEKYDLELIDPRKFLPENRAALKRPAHRS